MRSLAKIIFSTTLLSIYAVKYMFIKLPLTNLFKNLYWISKSKYIRSGALFDYNWYFDNLEREIVFKSSIQVSSRKDLSVLFHYLLIGHLKMYSPSPLFDEKWYKEKYEDVTISQMPGLVHYIKYGFNEGRIFLRAQKMIEV